VSTIRFSQSITTDWSAAETDDDELSGGEEVPNLSISIVPTLEGDECSSGSVSLPPWLSLTEFPMHNKIRTSLLSPSTFFSAEGNSGRVRRHFKHLMN